MQIPTPGQWTLETLRIFLYNLIEERHMAYQQRWEAQQGALAAALLAQKDSMANTLASTEKAITKAEVSTEKRFDSIKNEFDRVTQTLNEKIDASNKTALDKVEANSRTLLDRTEATNRAFSERMDDLKTYKDTTSGRSVGMHSGWMILLGAITVVNTLVNMFSFIKKG